MTHGRTRGSFYGRRAAQVGRVSLGVQPSGVVSGGDDNNRSSRIAIWSYPFERHELRKHLLHEPFDLFFERGDLF